MTRGTGADVDDKLKYSVKSMVARLFGWTLASRTDKRRVTFRPPREPLYVYVSEAARWKHPGYLKVLRAADCANQSGGAKAPIVLASDLDEQEQHRLRNPSFCRWVGCGAKDPGLAIPRAGIVPSRRIMRMRAFCESLGTPILR